MGTVFRTNGKPTGYNPENNASAPSTVVVTKTSSSGSSYKTWKNVDELTEGEREQVSSMLTPAQPKESKIRTAEEWTAEYNQRVAEENQRESMIKSSNLPQSRADYFSYENVKSQGMSSPSGYVLPGGVVTQDKSKAEAAANQMRLQSQSRYAAYEAQRAAERKQREKELKAERAARDVELIRNEPFFSKSGQAARVRNVGRVVGSAINPFDENNIVANVENKPTKAVLEYTANKPYSTAFILTGAYGAGKAAVSGVAARGAIAEDVAVVQAERRAAMQAERVAARRVAERAAAQEAEQTTRGWSYSYSVGRVPNAPSPASYAEPGFIAVQENAAKNLAKMGSEKAVSEVAKRGFAKNAAEWGVDFLKTGAVGVGLEKGTEGVGILTAPKSQRPYYYDMKNFNKAVAAGFETERTAINQKTANVTLFGSNVNLPSLQSIAYEINPFLSNQKGEYERGVREYYQGIGYSGPQLNDAVSAAVRQRKFKSFGEGAGLLGISASTERMGRKYMTREFENLAGKNIPSKKIGWKLFGMSVPQLAKAGFVEGATQEITQETARNRPLNPREIRNMGIFGGISAPLIGAPIIATSVRRKGISKTIEVASYVADPFEYPGDLTADITESIQKNVFKKEIKKPVLYENVDARELLNFGVVREAGKKSAGRGARAPILSFGVNIPEMNVNAGRGKSNSMLNSILGIPTSTKTPTPSLTSRGPSTPLFVNSFVGTPSPTPTPTPVFTPTPVNTPLPTPVETPTPEDIFTPTPVNTPLPTPVETPTPIPIPTPSPFLRIPPPVPFGLPIGEGGKGNLFSSRKSYVNELQRGGALLGDLLGVGSSPFAVNQKRKKSSVKRRKRR